MLNEERKRIILDITNERKSITIIELIEILNASESTVRRDLSDMDKKGLLKKVHGGAISLNNDILYAIGPYSQNNFFPIFPPIFNILIVSFFVFLVYNNWYKKWKNLNN